jgi:hypothetical protein
VSISWNANHHEQLDWHWRNALRPRLEGLTDEEYFWEPVPGCWSLRPRGESRAPLTFGSGEYVLDLAAEDLDPAPVTTIAWRIAHILVGCFVMRLDGPYFSGPQTYQDSYTAGYQAFEYAATAREALEQLDTVYAQWSAAVRRLGDEGLQRAAEGEWDTSGLVLHINREVIHHGAEIALLRDLYRAGFAGA